MKGYNYTVVKLLGLFFINSTSPDFFFIQGRTFNDFSGKMFAFTGCYRAKPYFDRLRRLTSVSVTHTMPKPTFTTVSPGGLTVEIRIMPENQW
jgi:hypothetical protein